jgi:tetratricopeptide (TPR) repeat protein
MNSFFIVFLIFIAVIAASGWINSPKKKTSSVASPVIDNKNQYQQVIIQSAERLIEVINESIKIANESMNADTKISRLDFAKSKLIELKRIEQENSFIALTQLPQVENTIAELEIEFLTMNYRKAADGNMRGQALEKEGNTDGAIREYEQLFEKRVDTPFTYKRLAIIYSKRKQHDEELRVLRAAIKNVPVENSAHYNWFSERLSKKS